jgi:aspartate/methionine/tyrosine aminotransferase
LPLSDLIEDVPAIVMRGISKEMPWPGSRCGWIEVYNGHNDPMFEQYIQSILNGVLVNRTNGAFYMSVVFNEGVLHNRQSLSIENNEVRSFVESLVNKSGVSLDKRFVYYLLGATGICVVPLSSFATEMQGFRSTLLETDVDRFSKIFAVLADSIEKYLSS